MKRFLVLGLSIVAAATIGGVAGFYLGWDGALKTTAMTDLFASAYYGTQVSLFRKYADPAGYEDALRAQLSFLDVVLVRDRNPSDQRMYKFDRALTLMRLSTVLKTRGAADEASHLAQDAEALCPATGIRDCSADKLVEVVNKLDNHLMDSSQASK